MKKFLFCLLAAGMALSLQARTYFVSPQGNDEAPGTLEQPFATLQKAVDVVAPADTIFLRGGVYMLESTVRVKAKQNAREDARIYCWAYQEAGKAPEVPILDGSRIPSKSTNEFKMSRCIYHNHEANYWHYKGITMRYANDNGMKLEGSYNIVENCVFYGNNDTGLQIGMFKDFSIEETKSFPISGQPEFNPNYSYCKYNVVINCDSYNNYDSRSFSGSDDGGDADGFACKLFPGPGTEFHGCRAWNNSDDNWDLYMVYHPIVIDHCWSYKAGYDSTNVERGNGNGFKLGGGGSSGGAAFDQSVGAHLVRNCISFASAAKGFDQNNAYEGMYIINNLSFQNGYNYRFPTVVKYGTMHLVNNIGFLPEEKNHEFLSEGKEGYVEPDAHHNSWILIDDCNLIKEGNKNDKGVKNKTKDHSAEFISLAVEDFMVKRNADGSLPKNGFGRLKEGSIFVDKGLPIVDYALTTAIEDGLSLDPISIPYVGAAPDLGAYELGDPDFAELKALTSVHQRVYRGDSIQPMQVAYSGEDVSGLTIDNLPDGLQYVIDEEKKTLVIEGVPAVSAQFVIRTLGAEVNASLQASVTLTEERAATLSLLSGESQQTINEGTFMQHIVYTWGGGAKGIALSRLDEGLKATCDTLTKTLTIHGQPSSTASYALRTIGGDGCQRAEGCVRVQSPRLVLLDWYPFQDATIPDSLAAYLSFNEASYLAPDFADGGGSVGALRLSKGDGCLQLNFPKGVADLSFRFYISGGRQLTVKYGETGTENTWTSGDSKSISKGSHEYNLCEMIPAIVSNKPTVVNLINSRSDGGTFNIKDLYMATHAELVYETEDAQGEPVGEPVFVSEEQPDALPMVQPSRLSWYSTSTALIVYGEVSSLCAYSLDGRCVAQSTGSQVLPLQDLPSGMYLVKVQMADGGVAGIKMFKD